MNYSISNKLFTSGLIVLLMIILMIVASQIVGGLFKRTSNDLVIEYNELAAVQELRFSISQLLLAPSSYAIFGNKGDQQYFEVQIHKSEEDLEYCEKVLTSSHDLTLLDNFRAMIHRVDSLGAIVFQMDQDTQKNEINLLLGEMNDEIDKGILSIDLLLTETKEEIDEYIGINNTIIVHSTITILSLGLIVAFIILVGGWFIIRSITKPIKTLVKTTKKISKGDRSAKVNIRSRGEFHELAVSFNKMVDNLEETTVSKNYLNDILKNMFDALVVTDHQLMIKSANKAATELLGYSETELVGKDSRLLFEGQSGNNSLADISENELQKQAFQINNMDYLVSKSGVKIAALLSCSILKNKGEKDHGLIVVAHDLTEKRAIEKKLEHSRKKRQIDINEAQEEERMRIATDMHDGLGQMLTAISYSVQEIVPAKESNPMIHEPVLQIQEQIDKAIREAKNLAHNLIPIVLKDFGLIVAIENLISRANDLYKTKFRFDAFDFNGRIDPKREKVLYRICQESMNNIVKHAQANNASYQLFWQDCSVVLVIEDDGVGFNQKTHAISGKNRGIGLISMKERVQSFDGNFAINSEPGGGTEIIVEIPCRLE